MSEQDDSLNCLRRMAGSCHITNHADYEYHLNHTIIIMRDGQEGDDTHYPYMNWFAAVGVYEITNKLPLRSNQMYDEMLRFL